MANDESKKATIEQQIAQDESVLQKSEREKKAAEEAAEQLNEQNQEIDNAIAFEEEEQLIAQEEQTAQPEPALPHWVTDLLLRGAEYFYENEFGNIGDGGAAAKDAAENVLSNFSENNLIQDFEETAQGFKVALEDGEDIIFNLMDNKIFSNSITDKAFEIITTVIKAIGGDKLDISEQKDEGARFSVWDNAVQKGLEVLLTPDEDEKFRQKEAMGIHKG